VSGGGPPLGGLHQPAAAHPDDGRPCRAFPEERRILPAVVPPEVAPGRPPEQALRPHQGHPLVDAAHVRRREPGRRAEQPVRQEEGARDQQERHPGEVGQPRHGRTLLSTSYLASEPPRPNHPLTLQPDDSTPLLAVPGPETGTRALPPRGTLLAPFPL